MKNVLYYLLFISFLFLPFNVFAQAYALKDMSISVDDSTWYVFTRDNLLNNPELDELGITYNYLNNFMNENDVYLDACQFDTEDSSNTIELFVVIKNVSNVSNLHTYSDSKINELGEGLKDKVGANSFDIYSVDKFKFVHIKYYDASTSYNIDEYYTVVNGYGYTIMAQKMNSFSSFEMNELKNIVDTISFKYNSTYERSSSGSSILEKALVGAITAGIIGGLSALFSKKKKKNDNNSEQKSEESNQKKEDTNKDGITICKNCGCKVLKDMDTCPKCHNSMKG